MGNQVVLGVSEEFGEKIREQYEGSNDEERLKNWAEEYESDSDNRGFSEAEIRSMIQEEIDDRLGVLSDKISEEIEEKLRQMNR